MWGMGLPAGIIMGSMLVDGGLMAAMFMLPIGAGAGGDPMFMPPMDMGDEAFIPEELVGDTPVF